MVNFNKKKLVMIEFLVVVFLFLGGCVLESEEFNENIYGFLPEKAQIAKIKLFQKEKMGVIRQDIDGDEKAEIIIAYYTEPHDYTDERFFRRAHVKILKENGAQLKDIWDSGGWGDQFGGRVNFQGMSEEIKKSYLESLFNVRDITGDGKPEIIFTRASFLAEGNRCEIWTWNGKEFQQIFTEDNLVRIEICDNKTTIISEFDNKGIKRDIPLIYIWDGKIFKLQNK